MHWAEVGGPTKCMTPNGWQAMMSSWGFLASDHVLPFSGGGRKGAKEPGVSKFDFIEGAVQELPGVL